MSAPMRLAHLGMSGFSLTVGDRTIFLDPPQPVPGPVLLSWSETDRASGARLSNGPLAASPGVLGWLGRAGVALDPAGPVEFGGFTVEVMPFSAIPYAVPAEALRKTLSALRSPLMAIRRVAATLSRPPDPPLVVQLAAEGRRVLVAGQALHRFTTPEFVGALVARFGSPDLLIAGTDFEDEVATGAWMGHFGAQQTVLADLIGPVRRALGLPVRPLALTLATAPPGTRTLCEGETLDLA